MWTAITTAVGALFSGWVEVKKARLLSEAEWNKAKLQAEADWDTEALRQAQYSWKDEFITLIWFTPLLVAWFDEDRALSWVNFINQMPTWYQVGMFGIIAASFGLRWFWKQQSLKIGGQLKGSGGSNV